MPLVDTVRRHWFAFAVGACTAGVAGFLFANLLGWPPHEDETLPLFVGRQPLGQLLHTVLTRRGGAPLHFMLAWVVAHLGGGLGAMRLLSALFAIASVPLIALLAARLAGRTTALAATAVACASWVLLFHGIYARMYSLFLCTSSLSYLALLAAIEHGGRRRWALWVVAVLLAVASHPYGAIVLASQGLYVLVTRSRVRQAVLAFGAVALIGAPFWWSDLVLAGRFDAGVGSGQKLGSATSVLDYLEHAAGDFSSGYRGALIVVLLLALGGLVRLWRDRPRSALLSVLVIATPALVLTFAHANSNAAAPESRHLIFALPFFTLLVGAGLTGLTRRLPLAGPAVAVAAIAALLPAELAWGWQKTPQLYTGEPAARISARHDASDWLAKTAQPNDILFGYDPIYLGAWRRAPGLVSRLVVPRADPKLAFRTLLDARKPLGRGVWVFDASDNNNFVKRLAIPLVLPTPPQGFEARTFGPFLVIRTAEPTRTIRNYLKLARRAELVGKSLDQGDADTNLVTVLDTMQELDAYAAKSRPAAAR